MYSVSCELANRGGLPLRCDVRFPAADRPLPVVLVAHGFKGFKDWGFFPHVGARLAAAGFLSVCFNFAGSGIGTDPLVFTELDRFAADTISQQVDDVGVLLDGLETGALLDAARRVAPALRVDTARTGILGHSRGSGTAIVRAREDARLRALVGWAGIGTFQRWTAPEIEAWRQRGYAEFLNARTGQLMRMNVSALEDLETHRQRFDLECAVAALEAPLLLIHGDQDLSVPVQEARTLFAAARTERRELRILPGTGHTFDVAHPWTGTTPALEAALEQTSAWFARHLGSPFDERAHA
jgi:dienelactone hydrolase